ncbi:MAG TPA: hypothetical protein VFR28_03870, partial [Allosphingosinicella sp.]|nr:hypothetical protein [Allosphingosinicella sp.]
MIELTTRDFQALCADGNVSERIGAIEDERKAAVRKLWLRGSIGLALAVGALVTLLNAGWEVVAIVVFLAFLIGTFIAAAGPVMAAKEGLKLPVLEEVARRAGLEYLPGDFDPPAFGAARLLFGGATSRSFTDLFHGKDEEGYGHAVYEACLQRRAGKSNVIIFQGQLYGIQRRSG